MPQLASFLVQPPQAIINNILWVLGFALQLSLVIALFSRHIVRRFPCFTGLIIFYLLRSAVLFFSFGHLDPDDYDSLYNALIFFDLIAQTAIAIELLHHLMRHLGGWTLRRTLMPAAFVFLASICTLLTAALLPAHSPIPVDRAQLFLSFLMVFIFTWALSIHAVLTRHIAAGFALYGIVNIGANFGRTYAALHRDVPVYTAWSYAQAGIYFLTVVLFWLLTLEAQPIGDTVPL